MATRKGERWSLRRWEEANAMRTVFKLERVSIQAVAEEQKKWADEWGFPAERATQI
ncbi:MAG: hypothetical protein P8127_08450 [Acidobacteriota bacterium]